MLICLLGLWGCASDSSQPTASNSPATAPLPADALAPLGLTTQVQDALSTRDTAVLLPDSVYWAFTPLVIDSQQTVLLRGGGPGSVLYGQVPHQPVLRIRNSRHVILEDLQIRHKAEGAAAAPAVWLENCDSVTLRRCWLGRNSGMGLQARNVFGLRLDSVRIDSATTRIAKFVDSQALLSHCRLVDNGYGPYFRDAGYMALAGATRLTLRHSVVARDSSTQHALFHWLASPPREGLVRLEAVRLEGLQTQSLHNGPAQQWQHSGGH